MGAIRVMAGLASATLLLLSALSLGAAPLAGARAPEGWTEYDTPNYALGTDMPAASARGIAGRLTSMAGMYRDRTRGFAGAVRHRLEFLIFRDAGDYRAAGGPEGSAGVFTGKRLMAVAGEELTPASWHVIQHEGFHQFAAEAIGGDLPAWVNEGLAEYFGEALFTGDDFVTGLIPPFRLKRLQASIREHPRVLAELMDLSYRDWNARLEMDNYDRAWSLVHFLAHGDGGKYAPFFERFIAAAGRGQSPATAWKQTFGDTDGLERRWRAYWLGLPADPTARGYAGASARIYATLLAEARHRGETPTTVEGLIASATGWAEGGPAARGLARETDNESARTVKWTIEGGGSAVAGEMADGTVVRGTFDIRGARTGPVRVRFVEAAKGPDGNDPRRAVPAHERPVRVP